MRPRTLFVFHSALCLGLAGWPGASSQAWAADGVQISKFDGKLRIEINGQLFTEYHYQDVPRPYFYPVLGPEQLDMTRKWLPEDPPGDPPSEEHDHPHHRGLWYAHGEVNGLDFWSEGKNFCKIVHDGFIKVESGADQGVIVSKDNWIGHDGQVVCTDLRTFRVYDRPASQRLFDFEITLQAPPDHAVVLGDTKEGTMATRLAETMRLTRKDKTPGLGHIVMSTGVRDGETWGKRADWCDYYGPVDGKTAGLAIFDHPGNPRHPTWWHVRDYGLFAANPFGLSEFEKKPKGTGNLEIGAGQAVTFRYRFYYHFGDEKEAQVAAHYDEYANAHPAQGGTK